MVIVFLRHRAVCQIRYYHYEVRSGTAYYNVSSSYGKLVLDTTHIEVALQCLVSHYCFVCRKTLFFEYFIVPHYPMR